MRIKSGKYWRSGAIPLAYRQTTSGGSIPATTPLIGGDLSVFRETLRHARRRGILALGDSFWTYGGEGAAQKFEFYRRGPLRVTEDFLVPDSAGLDVANCWATTQIQTGAYSSPASDDIGRIGLHSPWGVWQTKFLGTNSPAGNFNALPGTRTNARTLDIASLAGQYEGWAAPNVWAGSPIARSIAAGVAGKIRQVVCQVPTGNPNALTLSIRGSDVSQTAGTTVAGYAAALGWNYQECTIPTAMPVTSNFNYDILYPPSTACPINTYFLSCGMWLSTNEGNGYGILPCGVPGAHSSFWVDPSNFSAAAWSTLVPMMGITDLWLFLGANINGESAATHYANLLSIATSFRTGNPNGSIIIFSPPATANDDAAAGGDGYEAWCCAAGYAAAQAIPGCGFANLNRGMPPQRIMLNAVSADHQADNTHFTAQGKALLAKTSWDLIRLGAANPTRVTSVPTY